jgi:catechol 2,3-dioxygenase
MPALPPDTRMGAVHLSVAKLDRSIAYYESQIGLELRARENGRAVLGDNLLVLTEWPGARPADGYAGLFHFALLVPQRRDLARWLGHAVRDEVQLTGLSDHYVSEAIYLRDPDGHGIEIYCDRPRSTWEGEVATRLTTDPLDVRSLLSEDDGGYEGLPTGTVMGHVHLRVADVPAAEAFYTELIGFDVMARYGAQATFLAAGGYHHHLGANTWESRGAAPAPEGTARLERFTIVLPSAQARDEIAGRAGEVTELEDGTLGLLDPSGNPLALAVK